MPSDRERWDAKHRDRLGGEPRPPDPLVAELLDRLGPGAGRRALDLACGTGRHALLLGQAGWSTSAWDVSPVALRELERRAGERGLSIALEEVDLVAGARALGALFDLALIVDFLDRPLFARLGELVAPGGHALIAGFTEDWQGAHPSARYRLQRGELGRGLPGFLTESAGEASGRATWLGRRTGPGEPA